MGRLRGWASRLRGVFDGTRREQDLSDELESHLQLHVDDNIRQGMTPDAARTAALIRLGGLQSVTEQYRDQRSIPLLSRLRQDIRYAGRTLRRSPGFAAVALTTIALGIAGPTITFTMVKAWILEPLPFADPDALVDIRSIDLASGDTASVNAADFRDFQRGANGFSDLAGYRSAAVRLTGGDRAERVRGAQVTTGFFSVLGTTAALGRVFEPADGEPSAPKLVVISAHALARPVSRGTGRDWPHAASGRRGPHHRWCAARDLSLHAAGARRCVAAARLHLRTDHRQARAIARRRRPAGTGTFGRRGTRPAGRTRRAALEDVSGHECPPWGPRHPAGRRGPLST